MQEEKPNLQLHDYSMLSLIGVGNYAKVILVRKKSSGKLYAMKILKKIKHEALTQNKKFLKQQAFLEKQILTQIEHPFIVKLHSTFQHHRKLYFILEYCHGGELFGLIKRNARISEQWAKFYASEILLAIAHLHDKKYIYRDLKPENVLLDKYGHVRLVDFGLCFKCNKLLSDTYSGKIAGTPEYLPPEVFANEKEITRSADWWGLGSLIYEMVVGFPPFYKQKQSLLQMKEKILQDHKFLDFINSPSLKDLLSKLLCKQPKNRLGAKGTHEIKSHPWFATVNWDKVVKKELSPPFVPQIENEEDTKYFEMEEEEDMTPPENQNSKNVVQKYNSFSLSWRSSSKSSSPHILSDASPTEIVINIEASPVDK